MARKRPSRNAPDASHPMARRLAELCKRLWEGKKSKMAADLQVSNQVILRVLSGQQLPTGKLLEALGARDEVNFRWLFTGQGEPLIEEGTGKNGGRFRPIVDELLPGPPAVYRERLSGISFPVTDNFYSTTSYWFRVAPPAAITRHQPVRAGDLLLMETDVKWTRRLDAVLGQYVGFLVTKKRRTVVLLTKVGLADEGDPFSDPVQKYKVDTFGEFQGAVLLVPSTMPGGREHPRPSGAPEPAVIPVEPVAASGETDIEFGMGHVACVAVKLERCFGRGRK